MEPPITSSLADGSCSSSPAAGRFQRGWGAHRARPGADPGRPPAPPPPRCMTVMRRAAPGRPGRALRQPRVCLPPARPRAAPQASATENSRPPPPQAEAKLCKAHPGFLTPLQPGGPPGLLPLGAVRGCVGVCGYPNPSPPTHSPV